MNDIYPPPPPKKKKKKIPHTHGRHPEKHVRYLEPLTSHARQTKTRGTGEGTDQSTVPVDPVVATIPHSTRFHGVLVDLVRNGTKHQQVGVAVGCVCVCFKGALCGANCKGDQKDNHQFGGGGFPLSFVHMGVDQYS